jgi:hypothetical protein
LLVFKRVESIAVHVDRLRNVKLVWKLGILFEWVVVVRKEGCICCRCPFLVVNQSVNVHRVVEQENQNHQRQVHLRCEVNKPSSVCKHAAVEEPNQHNHRLPVVIHVGKHKAVDAANPKHQLNPN